MATLAVGKRKETTPPDGYICHQCNEPGHWIQQCPTKSEHAKKRQKKSKSSSRVPVAGVDPSQDDIDAARQMQKIPPPKCFCGVPSRLKKVKRSNVGGDSSRAIGKYFFFCPKKKNDPSACRFARPVEDEMKPKKERMCTFWAKHGSCKKGDKCIFSHDVSAAGVHVSGNTGKKKGNNVTAGSNYEEKKSDNVNEENSIDTKKDSETDESSDSDSSSVPSSSDDDDDSSDSSDGDDDDDDDDGKDGDNNDEGGDSSSSSSSRDESDSDSESESD